MKTARNAIRLLREFNVQSPRLGVSDLSRRLNLDRATVHRMLRTLYEERLIEQDADTRLYRLGPGVLELARAFLQQQGIVGIAQPHLDALRDETGETVGLKVLDGPETVCIATAEGRQAVRVSYYVGERMPLHCTSSGILFLAYMAPPARRSLLSGKLTRFTAKTVVDMAAVEAMTNEALRKGIAVSDEGYMEGTRTLSAPVLDSANDLIAAVTIIGPSQRLSQKQLAAMAPQIRRTADLIARDLGRVQSVRGARGPSASPAAARPRRNAARDAVPAGLGD